jgi:hypothetical protein
MALTDVLKLRTKAKLLGVPGYKRMSADELRKAIGSANGSSTKTAAKTAVSKSVGRKTAGRKTASAKSAPAAKTAKRQTTGAKRGPGRPRKAVAAPVKRGRPAKAAPKAPARRGRPAKTATNGASKNYHGGRNLIDDSAIDWTAEWNVSGIRGEIFKALKKAKGDTDKTYDALESRATEFWKKNRAGDRILKDRALAILRWNISRVKFDFVMATKQHKVSKKFGTLGTTAPKPKTARKPTRTAAKPQRAAQSRTAAPKRRGRPPGSKNRTTAARKSTARGRKTTARK